MASLYLDESLAAGSLAVGAEVVLSGEEARHAVRVARVRIDEWIGVGDGRGRIAWGPVVAAESAGVVLRAERVDVDTPPRPALWLVQALAKGGRDEHAIRAATELGVTGVLPWAATRSVARWDRDKADRGVQRWRSIVREASKQSIRATVPEVGTLVRARDIAEGPGRLLVLDPTAENSIGTLDLGASGTVAEGTERITLVVGPEGGIAAEEIRELTRAGADRVRLGPEVLRTATAGPAALAALNVLLGRW